MALVRERGRAMAAAAAVTRTSMTAVLGGDEAEVVAKIEQHGLTPANRNGAGQIVAAGTVEQLAAFDADPPVGARLRALPVAGAFHTGHMAPAVARMAQLAKGVPVRDPRVRYISNRDGAVVHSGREVVDRMVNQIANPVRWDLCMEAMRELGVTGLLEMPPAGTLVGLARRALPGVETFALKTPDQLDAARAFVAKHADGHNAAHSLDTAPTWRLVVAPFSGTVQRGLPGGGSVEARSRAGPRREDRRGGLPPRGAHAGRRARRVRCWNGSSRTATRSPPASPCCASTRRPRHTEHDRHQESRGRPARPHPRSGRLPPLPRHHQRADLPGDRLHRRVDPHPQPASRSGAGAPPRRPSG